jgi:succinyl-diaminopimelate desuccinylase
MNPTIELTQQLVACPSITPDDAGCQEILIHRLKQLDFQIESMPFGDVKNFWARRGNASPLFVFVGHTDVVPTGPLDKWTSPPFQPEIREGYLYGRGSADMKGSLAAMLVACENFVAKHPQHQGSIAWLITSDEEGPSVDGTKKVAEVLEKRGEKIDWCLVGEPSCEEKFGDVVKIGRRGTLSGKLIVHGKQGHIAYPHLAENPIHKASAFIHELTNIIWDEGNDYFSPTSLQISNIHAGTGAGNVIPGDLEIQFNFRYSPALDAESLQKTVVTLLEKFQLRYSLEWRHSGNPFLTSRGVLAKACEEAIQSETGISPLFSTHGGTSDGRFIAPLGAQVVEFGPRNRSIHQIDECVCVEDLVVLTRIYERVLERLLGNKK